VDFRVILARPRNPDNIGAAARARPTRAPGGLAPAAASAKDGGEAGRTGRAEASCSASGGMDGLTAARLCASVPEAAEGCDLLLGTSSLHFLNPERDVVLLKDAAAFAGERGAEKVAVLFGAEKTGLTREELSYCSAVVNIQTLPNQPSMNLGQAVAVACYELAGRPRPEPRAGRKAAPPAPPAELARMADLISVKLCREGQAHWAGAAQLREIRQALLDARLTKGAMTALKLLLKEK